MDPITTSLIFRGTERLLIVIAGVVALWMGWKLFLALKSKAEQKAEISYKGFLLKLQRVGPGVFFALFGSFLLYASVSHPLNIYTPRLDKGELSQKADACEPSIRYLRHKDRTELQRWVVALNTVIAIGGIPADSLIPNVDRKLLNKAIPSAEELRNDLLKGLYQPQDVDLWLGLKRQLSERPNSIPPEIEKRITEIQHTADMTLFEEK